jgi:tetratricopeptide (TPR) repeat protein
MTHLRLSSLILALGLVSVIPAGAQQLNARERARPAYDRGIEEMRMEALEAAARSFQSATEIDPTFDAAFYMLGRTHLSLRQYQAAVQALTSCRDIHLAEASRVSQDRREGARLRKERVDELRRFIGELQIENLDREAGAQKYMAVPAYVSLSLGSAYFRAGDLAEAEKAYLETVATDSKIGEAYNNLAVVYMETGRYAEAEQAVKDAEKTGMRVPQALKDEIRKRKGGTS